MTAHSLTVGDRVLLDDIASVTPGEIIAVLNYGWLASVRWPNGSTTTHLAADLRRADG